MAQAVKATSDTPPTCVIEKQFLVSIHNISNSYGENNVYWEWACLIT
jgi:hypothetical protein